MMHDRFQVQIAATFLTRSRSTSLLTDYVTPFSVFVRTDAPPQAMELLRIEFELPHTGAKVVMHGMVTRIVLPKNKHCVPGAEVSFFAKGGDAGRTWDEFLEYLAEAVPQARGRAVKLAVGAVDKTRRAHERYRLTMPVTVTLSDGDGDLVVGDISHGGMFLKTEEPFDIGAKLRLTLVNPTSQVKIPLECIVRRRASGASAGVGLEFRNMNDDTRAELAEFIRLVGPEELCEAHCEELAPRRGKGGSPARIANENSWTPAAEGT